MIAYEMKHNLESIDFLKRDGITVDVFFISRCMKHYRRVAGPVGSGASRTIPSDIVYISPPTRHETSSAIDNSPSVELVSIWRFISRQSMLFC